jgi:hypothetical protein
MESNISILNHLAIIFGKTNSFEELVRTGNTEKVVQVVCYAMEKHNNQKQKEGLYTLDTVITLAEYGFTFARTTKYAKELPLENALQRLMFEKNYTKVPQEFKDYQTNRDLFKKINL